MFSSVLFQVVFVAVQPALGALYGRRGNALGMPLGVLRWTRGKRLGYYWRVGMHGCICCSACAGLLVAGEVMAIADFLA